MPLFQFVLHLLVCKTNYVREREQEKNHGSLLQSAKREANWGVIFGQNNQTFFSAQISLSESKASFSDRRALSLNLSCRFGAPFMQPAKLFNFLFQFCPRVFWPILGVSDWKQRDLFGGITVNVLCSALEENRDCLGLCNYLIGKRNFITIAVYCQ